MKLNSKHATHVLRDENNSLINICHQDNSNEQNDRKGKGWWPPYLHPATTTYACTPHALQLADTRPNATAAAHHGVGDEVFFS